MGPDVFYPAVASRLVDFWANGWFPLQDAKLETALPARGIVGDLASPVGSIVPDGALLGYLVDKPTADQHGIVSMNDLKRPEIAAIFDRDGNGKADLIGCSEGWACANYINDQIAAQGWLVEQVQGDYPILFDDVATRVQAGPAGALRHLDPELHDRRAGSRPGRDVAAGAEPARRRTPRSPASRAAPAIPARPASFRAASASSPTTSSSTRTRPRAVCSSSSRSTRGTSSSRT